MAWDLDPPRYLCPLDGTDLTELVRAEAIPSSTPPPWVSDAESADDADAATEEWSPEGPFHVRVDCPGRATEGGRKRTPAVPHVQHVEGVVR